jgi:hypothetical protein
MTVTLKTNYIAKSKKGDLFVILSESKLDNEFPFKAKKIISRKATTPTDTVNSYTFTKAGLYNASGHPSENDLVESRPLKNGESFKYADTLQIAEFLSCHDLVGLFEVTDVSQSERPEWLK